MNDSNGKNITHQLLWYLLSRCERENELSKQPINFLNHATIKTIGFNRENNSFHSNPKFIAFTVAQEPKTSNEAWQKS